MTKSSQSVFSLFLFFFLMVLLVACGGPEEVVVLPTATETSPPPATNTAEPTATNTVTAVPTETPEPTHTPTSTPTPKPTATAISISLDEPVVVAEGGYVFQPVMGYLTEVQGSQAGVVSEDDEIILFMITDATGTEKSLEEVLAGFVEAVRADAGAVEPGDPYPYVVDGQEGLAVDVTGDFLGDAMEGKIVIASPNQVQTFIAFGFAVNDRWADEGTAVFEAVVQSVEFSVPEAEATEEAPAENNSDFPLPIPTGDPVADWDSIPIMPKAIAGDGDSGSYYFTIAATQEEVMQFYEREMGRLGWSLLGSGEGATGAILMIFQQGDAVASASILQYDDDTVYVFLVQ